MKHPALTLLSILIGLTVLMGCADASKGPLITARAGSHTAPMHDTKDMEYVIAIGTIKNPTNRDITLISMENTNPHGAELVEARGIPIPDPKHRTMIGGLSWPLTDEPDSLALWNDSVPISETVAHPHNDEGHRSIYVFARVRFPAGQLSHNEFRLTYTDRGHTYTSIMGIDINAGPEPTFPPDPDTTP